jgi:2-polyprenyl-3-methyl-5-hydroxy-6-metoxy-1,4-benzoquinol methylase
MSFLFLFSSCGNDKKAMGNSEISAIINKKDDVLIINKDENKNREKWQKPEIVMALMGDLKDKNVADIGAGTGYFTFRIAMKAKKVIAVDIEKNYLDILDNLKEKLPEEIQSKIETRLAKVNDPLLKSGEVDLVVIINTFSFIKNKKEYLKIIKKDLKPNGRIFIVDFKMKNLPIDAPDESDRLPLNKLENFLEKAGFKNIQSDDTTLDYQYIVIADK